MDQVQCEICGVFYGIGDYPFCKGGHGRARGIVVGDDIPGGMWQENGFSQPIKVHSWSELHRRLAAEGLQIAPRYVEGSKHLTKWVSVDLEAAKALVSRGVTSTTAPTGPGGLALLEPHPDYPITVTDAGWTITSREATRE